MRQRVQTIFNNLKQPLDGILLKNASEPFLDKNFFYVTGLEHGLFEGSFALLHSDGTIDLVVSELEAESATSVEAKIHIYKRKDEAQNIIKQLTTSTKTIGINFSGLTYRDFILIQQWCPQATFIDISQDLTETRLVKDDKEIDRIRHACLISDTVMEKIPGLIHDNMRENELAAEIDYLLQKHGAEKPAFETISSFGKNTAEPHYSHSETALKKGDFIVCDFGSCFKRYNSDITRTFIYGSASPQQKDMYKVVAQAQQIGFEKIHAGIPAQDVHMAVSSYIDATPFKGRFIHSTGHSLGLAVHDAPGFTSDNAMILKENMVLTVEPGIYIPGFGGVRIEDDIIVKKQGMELLTHSSQKLLEL